MYEFWYDYVKLKYSKKAKLCYVDTDSSMVYIKTNDVYKDIAKDVETRFDTSNYELDRPLPKGKNKKDELRKKIKIKFFGLRGKTYIYLIDENEQKSDTKKCLIKIKHKFEIYKNCLEAIQLDNKLKNKINIDSLKKS